MTLSQILNTEGLSQRLIVYFASQCAKDIADTLPTKGKDQYLKAIDLAERYGLGEEGITAEELKAAADAAASYAASSAASAYSDAAAASANAAANAAYSATYTAYASSAAYAASYAANAASYAAKAKGHKNEEYYKPLLLKIIDERLSKVEKILIFGREEF